MDTSNGKKELTCASALFDHLRYVVKPVRGVDLAKAVTGWTDAMVCIALNKMVRDGLVLKCKDGYILPPIGKHRVQAKAARIGKQTSSD